MPLQLPKQKQVERLEHTPLRRVEAAFTLRRLTLCAKLISLFIRTFQSHCKLT